MEKQERKILFTVLIFPSVVIRMWQCERRYGTSVRVLKHSLDYGDRNVPTQRLNGFGVCRYGSKTKLDSYPYL